MLYLMKFLKPYRLTICATLLFVFLLVLGDLYLPTLMADVVNNGVLHGDIAYIWKIGGLMLIVSVVATIFSILSSYFAAKVSTKFAHQLRQNVFEHVESFSLAEFDKIGTSSLINRTTNDITQVQNFLLMVLRVLVMTPLMCIGGIIMAINQNVGLSSIFVIVIPVLLLAIIVIMRTAIPYFKALQLKLDKLNLVLRENLIGIRVIRAFTRTNFEQGRFDEANKDMMNTAVKINQIMALSWPLMMLIMNLSSVAIVWFGSKRIDIGNMEIGDLLAFIQYGMMIMFSLLMLSMMLVMLPRAQASAVRISEVLQMEPSIVQVEQHTELDDVKKSDAALIFNNVSFSYPGAEAAALSHINFTAKKGEITAIIGGTGSGKSTIVNLIERFYDVTSGKISYCGVPIKEMAISQYRGKIGIVPQKVALFSGTIAENIRYGNANATDEEVEEAATIAQASTFIEELEQRYNEEVAQGGVNFSGGQKQRLAMARAIVRRPELYVFDDSFSALDYKTDAGLRTALKPHIAEAIVIIVAQRVSTVIDADQIIVLDDGAIAGNGTHEELLESSSVYREIVQSQLTKEEE